jgi:hypothetical protein
MKIFIPASAALALCAWLGFAGPVMADDFSRTFRVSTRAGKEVKINSHSRFNAQCVVIGTPSVTTTVKPAHGSVILRDVVHQVGTRTTAETCNKKWMRGIGIYYRPNPGFRGEDRFSYDVYFAPNWVFRDTAIITVR